VPAGSSLGVRQIAIFRYRVKDLDDAFVTPSGIVGDHAHSTGNCLRADAALRACRDAVCKAWGGNSQGLRSNDAEMKVREVLTLLERDGWYLVRRAEATASSNIPEKLVW